MVRLFPQNTNPYAVAMPGLIAGKKAEYQSIILQQLRSVNEKTTLTQAATIARRVAIIPKLVEDFTPYLALGKLAADDADMRAATPRSDDDMNFYSYGAILLRAGKTDDAILQLERAAKLQPARVFSMQFLALAYAQHGDKAAARQWFDKSEAWIKTEMDKEFPGAENWAARLQVLLLCQECKQVLGVN